MGGGGWVGEGEGGGGGVGEVEVEVVGGGCVNGRDCCNQPAIKH